MPATPLNPAERFSALSGLQIVFIPVIAAATFVPTRPEIDAGTDLTSEVMDWNGFTTKSSTFDTPDLTRFVGKIPGKIESEDSSLMMYLDRSGDDVRTVLPRDTIGFFGFMDAGDVADALMDIYPIQVTTFAKVRKMDAATVANVEVVITRIPIEDVVIPAAA